MESVKPIAIVIPWFGKNLKGGAEQQAWQVAVQLRGRGHLVEVLTTCCQAFQEDWSTNYFTAGISEEQGVTIRRFRVDVRDRVHFDQVNAHMLSLPAVSLKPGVAPVSQYESDIFTKENINSSSLLNYLRGHENSYQAFIFVPYLYGPILNGLPLVADRAFLQPCLHNEVYAYLPQVERIFRVARGLFFNSEGELSLAYRLYGPGILRRSVIVGEGVEIAPSHDTLPQTVGSFRLDGKRFVLFLGRRDVTKNVDLLVAAYKRFNRDHSHSTLKLVLAGPGTKSYGNTDGIVDLGLVEEQEKVALLTSCLALFQPSRNESYSRVIMEAWLLGRPIAADRECLATASAVERARGGWLAETETEWADLFTTIDTMTAEELTKYGANGRLYANENAAWDKVIDRYEAVLGLSRRDEKLLPRRRRKLREIHQLLPNLTYGDAISNHALAIRNCLRTMGYASEIFVRYVDKRLTPEAKIFYSGNISKNAGLLYHHSIGSELTPYAVQHKGPKCLIYHNITPAEFFAPYRPAFAKILEKGRNDLNKMARHFSLSVGVSSFNAFELTAVGFQNPGVLPLVIDPDRWNLSADAAVMRQFQDGRMNLLFVGRLAPNKRQDLLVEAFAHYLTMDPEARLILVGGSEADDPYSRHLLNMIEERQLTTHVVIAGVVSDQQLLAYYRCAHLFWSMSEHEGFCVPVVEAMWFDLPVLAYKSTAIPDTLKEAGVMFTTKDDLVQIAALAKLLVRDENLRAKVLAAQKKRRQDFLPEVVWPKLDTLLNELETS